MERVMLFIDWENLRGSVAGALPGRQFRINASSLLTYLTGKRKLVRAYVYTAMFNDTTGQHERQQAFITALRRTDFVELRLGQLKEFNGRFYQKGVDVRIALDMVRLAYHNAYDVAVLVSGDGDLVEAVRLVRDLGKNVELAYFDDSVARELLDNTDRRLRITPSDLNNFVIFLESAKASQSAAASMENV